MSQPTEAQLVTQWQDAVKILNETRKFGSSNASNYLGLEQTFVTDVGVASDFGPETLSGMAGFRARLDAALRECPNVLRPILRQYGAIIKAPETSDNDIGQRLYDYYNTNAFTIKTRGLGYGSPAAGANTGSGSIFRLSKDQNNYPIESVNAEAKTAKCVQDQTTGVNSGEEVFEFRGAARFKDSLNITGSGEVQRYPAVSAAGSLLSNAGFSILTGGTSAAPTGFSGWTPSPAIIGDGSDVKQDTVNYYRTYPGNPTPSSVALLKTMTFTQALSVRSTKIDPNRPYFYRIAWRADVATPGVGTLTITLGSLTVSVVVSGQTGWQILKIPVDYHVWYQNWTGNAPTITIAWTRTSGQINFGDAIFCAMQPHNSTWYVIDGGATPFLRNDIFTWTDTDAGTGLLQYWFWRAFGRYLPSSGLPTYADPA